MSGRYWRRRIRPMANHWRGEDIGPVLSGETVEDERIVRPGTTAYRQLAGTTRDDRALYAFAEKGQAPRLRPPASVAFMHAGWLAPGCALWVWQTADTAKRAGPIAAVLLAVGLLLLAHAGQIAALRGLRDARMAIRHRSWDRLLTSSGKRRAHSDRREGRRNHGALICFAARMEIAARVPVVFAALLALFLTMGLPGAAVTLGIAMALAIAASICEGLGAAQAGRLRERSEAASRRAGQLKYMPWAIGYGALESRLQIGRNFVSDQIRRLNRQSRFDDTARSIDLAGLTLPPLAGYTLAPAGTASVTALFALALSTATISFGRAAVRLRMTRATVFRPESGASDGEPLPFIRLEASAISHAHGTGAALFHPVSFTLAPGKVLALAGPSGIGKSSLMHLLMGLETPQAGQLLVNGEALDHDRLQAWRMSVACVMQDEGDEPGTISAVIGAGLADVSPETIEAAARAACVHDEIMTLPMGYMTLMIEGAVPRAFGARIAIARCFAAQPKILFLDETLSSLDREHAAQILANARTTAIAVVIASHRQDILALADQIVALRPPFEAKVE
ncbi:ATP-binding cassette domain-containing protein (plasmid) [Ensifer sp. PDNC004]|uniref:ABC transporter ATP-binding protein n=1 Tax=Ensifer sp. PDNC004 TaxID=2811423 RepID=UPI00196640BA|nr:ABC transporter ATP-binding protein [Ensifer sp. PDNC004]QRY65624.1 ATP-binding cassette domain-containing protein [Ensifer sp. PDNC004]